MLKYSLLLNSFKKSLQEKLMLRRENGNISEDVIVMFNEMYLQNWEEYCGGETLGTDENGQLYKEIVCFMTVGLKSSVPYNNNSP